MKKILVGIWLLTCSFNQAELKSMLKRHKVKHIEIVVNQARLETANFTSRGFKELNNPFGFTLNGKLMRFDSINHSIAFLKSFQQRKMKPNENYYSFLKRIGWATDKDYIKKLKQF